MAQILTQRNVNFRPLEILHKVIFDNVRDPNVVRSSKPTPRERNWIFPDTPEANDENYPRIAIIQGKPRIEEWTAGQHLKDEIDTSKKLVREINSNLITIPVTIGIFTKKTKHQALEVDEYDGTKRFVENKAQVAYLLDRIQKEIHIHRIDFINEDIDMKILDIEGAYEDNDFLWAGHISMEIWMDNIWTRDIDKIINNIDLTIDVELIGG